MQSPSEKELLEMEPRKLRDTIRRGWVGLTRNVCRGYGKANLVILPKEYAFDFLLFCNRNPLHCTILEVTEPGVPEPKQMAPGADLRTDLPRYRVFKHGEEIDRPDNIISYWRDDLVGFLFGCSVGFVWALKATNIQFKTYGVYRTNLSCIPAGRFHGPMALSFRGYKNSHDAVQAIQISSRHILFHGAPIHIGHPADIGVKNFGIPSDPCIPNQPIVEPPSPSEIVMGSGCGVTAQLVAMESKIPFMITHCPGHLLMIDNLCESLAVI